MRSADIGILQQLVNAANGWRQTALSANVNLDILTTRINGEIVQLQWDANLVQWEVRTAESKFQLSWTENATDPSLSEWTVVSN